MFNYVCSYATAYNPNIIAKTQDKADLLFVTQNQLKLKKKEENNNGNSGHFIVAS